MSDRAFPPGIYGIGLRNASLTLAAAFRASLTKTGPSVISIQRQDSFNDGGASQWELAMYQQGLPLADHQQPYQIVPAAFSEATMSYASGKDASWLRLGSPVPSGVFSEHGNIALDARFDGAGDSTAVRSLLFRTRNRLARRGDAELAFIACPQSQVITSQPASASYGSKRCKAGTCHVCGPKELAEWRRGPSGPQTLCA